jgi:hypothetical protein
MKCLDLKLNPAPRPHDWNDLLKVEFICSGCMKALPSRSDELFFFPEVDFVFHKHSDRSFNRALILTGEGNVRISAHDSEDENVLQLISINLDGLGGHKLRFRSLGKIHKASKKFFNTMRKQKREIIQGTVHMGPGGTFHYG